MDAQPQSNSHIELRANRDGQPRAFITGTRVRVQDIVHDAEGLGMSADEIVANLPHLTLSQVYAALSYYFDHQLEVREAMRADDEFAAQMEREQRPLLAQATKDV
jgi:uncharacterized protein (DUF433 family)